MKTTRARTSDPLTSHAAVPTNAAIRASQLRVKNMFVLYGDMHDQQLLSVLHEAEKSAGLKPMSPSGARTRRSELSKPNMDRLIELSNEWLEQQRRTYDTLTPSEIEECEMWCRDTLRTEGFRSPLWDTGKREKVGRNNVIIWGLAH